MKPVKDMKKATIVTLLATILIVSATCMHVLGADTETDPHGPAPYSGDGNPDGSGFDQNDWPNDDSPAVGPAPNSGDGIPDGSGF